ncbi:hypothetical protein B0H17DRAFT_1197370 [Mycena rosella]|uniref:Ornithine decarboxylase antizyme n=1 Tax=Mycena rosella TaxID=1033263 RepID=A0AAD7GJC2_MYCRO|nr:hypothetical protein B0H17DRAFT_1197370 [Mycena rosella]
MSIAQTMSNLKQKSGLCPTNGHQTVGDGAALSLSTPSLVCLLCAVVRARTTCTTILLLLLAGPGGGFDVPNPKCPPDRGSSDCVTGSPASISPASNFPYFSNYYHPPSNPRLIPASRSSSGTSSSDLATPPLTPDNGSGFDGSLAVSDKNQKDVLDFLLTIFPRHGVGALAHSRSVAISAPHLGAAFDGVVLQVPGKPKTLYYVNGKNARIVALLDLADESLECSALVIVLERSSPSLGKILHSLMYVGGTVVTKPPFEVDPAFVLVGSEI